MIRHKQLYIKFSCVWKQFCTNLDCKKMSKYENDIVLRVPTPAGVGFSSTVLPTLINKCFYDLFWIQAREFVACSRENVIMFYPPKEIYRKLSYLAIMNHFFQIPLHLLWTLFVFVLVPFRYEILIHEESHSKILPYNEYKVK